MLFDEGIKFIRINVFIIKMEFCFGKQVFTFWYASYHITSSGNDEERDQ